MNETYSWIVEEIVLENGFIKPKVGYVCFLKLIRALGDEVLKKAGEVSDAKVNNSMIHLKRAMNIPLCKQS